MMGCAHRLPRDLAAAWRCLFWLAAGRSASQPSSSASSSSSLKSSSVSAGPYKTSISLISIIYNYTVNLQVSTQRD